MCVFLGRGGENSKLVPSPLGSCGGPKREKTEGFDFLEFFTPTFRDLYLVGGGWVGSGWWGILFDQI